MEANTVTGHKFALMPQPWKSKSLSNNLRVEHEFEQFMLNATENHWENYLQLVESRFHAHYITS